MDIFQAIIIAIVEGITEFLPISSTGHMIITEKLLGIGESDFRELFTVGIQLGAILSVVVLYWKKFFDISRWRFYLKLLIAVIPVLIIGYFIHDYIKRWHDSTTIVVISMILGGVVLLFIDNYFRDHKIETEEKISSRSAFVIGIWQVISLIPGVSRSAASIIGGMQQKLTRKLAAEFSFFLAVPTMLAATAKELLDAYRKNPDVLKDKDNLVVLGVGNLVAFIVAMLAIKFFIGYLQKHGFRIFGYYRIIVGIILLLLMIAGYLPR